MPRWMIAASSIGSMLPPPSTSPTVRSANRCGSFSRAASGAAPAPSTRVFSMSSNITMACSTSPSSTSTMSSTWRSTSGWVNRPGWPTAIPSAMVDPPAGKDACFTALYIFGKRSACTPITRMPGLSALAAAAMPPIRPPPPTATTSVPSCGTASSISRATGALAGDDGFVVVGVDEHPLLPRRHIPARACAIPPARRHAARPRRRPPRVRSTFTMGRGSAA